MKGDDQKVLQLKGPPIVSTISTMLIDDFNKQIQLNRLFNPV